MWMRHWRQATVIILALTLLASCGFFVDPVLTSISISPSTALVKIGNSQTFTALGVNQDNSTRTVTPSWSTSDATIATITAKGVATGVANGTATITGTVGAISATATLNVSNATVSSIAIGNCPTSSVNPGASISLTATATLSDQTTQVVTTAANWTATNATVGLNTGVVTVGTTDGTTATVMATYSGVTSNTCSFLIL